MEQIKQRLMRTKTLISQGSFESDGAPLAAGLKKVLTTVDLVSLGVGSCVGTGVYVVAGMVAKNVAGPSAIFSFMLAAAASMLSGACYGEFGVRVPKTSGSAYMYSYVAVGEFLAFITGWNIILEYMIGSAAGASALSACLDALVNHSMSAYLEEHVGTVIGDSYPDFIGFAICLLMTAVLAYGVQCSARFNNVLNAISLVIWLFIVGVGVFFAKGSNWNDFTPYGTSGVFAGAATCFYAFIGFDIIGTTGAEAREPSHSIPRAILFSLILCLIAYVSVTIILTLMVPYNDIVAESALLDVFVQVGFPAGKYIVAIGAVASLTVSLLGSMFPMPRVVYSMARDGLLFGFLATIHPFTSTPLIATVITGVLSAFMSLFFSLEMLVQLMSIGTLLAYTLVCLSVLILRYQPDVRHPQDIPMKAQLDAISESSETQSDYSGPSSRGQKMGGDTSSLNDSNLLLSPGDYDPRSYGSFAFAGPYIESATTKVLEVFEACWLKLGFPPADLEPTSTSAQTVILWTGLLIVSELVTCITIVFGAEPNGATWAVLLSLVFLAVTFMCLMFIMRQPQNKMELKFMAPAVPVLPACAAFFNIYLMLKLPPIIWARLSIWLLIGLVMYFGYSMWHSVKERKKGDQGQQGALEADQSVAAIYRREKMAAYGDGGKMNGTVDHAAANQSSSKSGERMAQAEKVIQSQTYAHRQVQSVAEVHQSDVSASPHQQRYVMPQQPAYNTYAEPVQPSHSFGGGHTAYSSHSQSQQSSDDSRRWLEGAAADHGSSSYSSYHGDNQSQQHTDQHDSSRQHPSEASFGHANDYQRQQQQSQQPYSQGQGQVDRNPPSSIARSRPRPQSRSSQGELNLKLIGDVRGGGGRRGSDQQQQEDDAPSSDLINW